MSLRQVRAIFNAPKPMLKRLDLNLAVKSNDLVKVMKAIVAGGINALESVRFELFLPTEGTFNQFVKMSPHLREVDIKILGGWDAEEDLKNRAVEISRCFLRSNAIKRFDVDSWNRRGGSYPEVRDLLHVKFRYRRVPGNILGTVFPQG